MEPSNLISRTSSIRDEEDELTTSTTWDEDAQEMSALTRRPTPTKTQANKQSKVFFPQKVALFSLLLNLAFIVHEFFQHIMTGGPNEIASVTPKQMEAIVTNNAYHQNHTANVIYAHIHMAKTAGTEINGELAIHYERICGHKGYSFDSYKVNMRNEQWIKENPNKILTEQNGPEDSITDYNYNRGRVPIRIMNERGYHDCDWVSQERPFQTWIWVAQHVKPFPLEFHVPCRDPVDHLLSMGNHRRTVQGKKEAFFNCSVPHDQIPSEVNKLLLIEERFDGVDAIKEWNSNLTKGIAFKCFSPFPIDNYLQYMSTRLQPRRLQRSYVHRDTNKPRDKQVECLLEDAVLKEKVRQYLEKEVPIFNFCKSCMGTKDDLLASAD